MSKWSGQISRRTLLRGAGAALALPFLEAAAPLSVLASTPPVRPPLRMGIFTVTGGTVLESWRPTEEGRLSRLPSILRPLEPFRQDVLVLSGLSHDGRTEGLNGHEGCAVQHLTGAEFAHKVNGRFHADISVDQAAAQVIGRQTYLPSLEIGLAGHENVYSFRAPDQPMPYEANPRVLFNRMFRGRQPVVPNWQRRAAAARTPAAPVSHASSGELSVIDLVLEDANSLRGRLGRADQHRMDEYLHSVRSVERRLSLLEDRLREEQLDAANPGPSRLNIPANLPAENVPTWQITRPVHNDPEKHAEYIRLTADMMVLAFQTDSTRVVTLAAGSDEARFPGVVTVGYEHHCHTLEHQGNSGRPEDADPIAREALRQIHVWYTELFADMVGKMKAIDEGGSSLLDNCMLLYTSYMADGGHGTHNYPVLLAGRAGGALRTGRHLAYRDRTPVANLYVEMLNIMGIPTESFGNSQTSRYQAYDGRLPGLS